MPASRQRCPKARETYWLPRSEWWIGPSSGCRAAIAIAIAPLTGSARGSSRMTNPTQRRE
jgi:hypothetical protein